MSYYSARMKKGLFFLYASIIVVALVLALIFIPKIKQDKKDYDDLDENVYATNIFLNTPREIKVQVGSNVILKNDFLVIEPSNCTAELTIEITSKVDNVDGITFENNMILAHEEGFYYIEFSVPKSETATLTETLVINAVKDTTDIKLLKDWAYVNEELSLNELLEINSCFVISTIETDENTIFENNTFKFTSPNSANIIITLNIGYVNYIYEFYISINEMPEQSVIPENPTEPETPLPTEDPEEPEEPNVDNPVEPNETPPEDDVGEVEQTESQFEIQIISHTSEIINFNYSDNKKYTIVFQIAKDGIVEGISQKIDVEILNTEVVSFVSADAGFLVLKAEGTGTTQITMVCAEDKNSTKILTITLS